MDLPTDIGTQPLILSAPPPPPPIPTLFCLTERGIGETSHPQNSFATAVTTETENTKK